MHQRLTTFGEQLRRFRLRVGLSQAALAEQANLSTAAVTALECGARSAPYPRTLEALARALELSPQERRELIAATPSAARRAGGTRVVRARQDDARSDDQSVSDVPQLPRWPTILVGRAADVDRVRSLLSPAGSAARVLTLVGPGGVGKTRLACAAAAGLAADFPDGIVFVDLAPFRDARLVPVTIARALALRESAGRSAREQLLEYLSERRILLVLDNFEHLLEAAPLIVELVSRCPRLAVLVTSRTALRVRCERRYAVVPLATPGTAAVAGEPAAADWPSVQMFIERARASVPDFGIQTDRASTIASICRRVDGIPLAIELAAARMPLLSPEALLRRLERPFPVLTAGTRDLPSRQQTLHDTLTWSYDLLEPAEQVLFQHLAVFAGGWTLEAAEAVCADAMVPVGEVLDRLQELVDSSLVRRLENGVDEPRFGMLQTVREFALQQLQAHGQGEAQRERHAAYYLNLAETVRPDASDALSIRLLVQEQDNLRTALRWCIDARAARTALRLGVALHPFWYTRELYAEGTAWLGEALALSDAASPSAIRAHALALAGNLLSLQADLSQAETLLRDAVAMAEQVGAAFEQARARHLLSNVTRRRGALDEAADQYEQAATLAREAQRPGVEAWAA
jgi:predicted ATPase/transcriptional regulator with XRE-family HTH domain